VHTARVALREQQEYYIIAPGGRQVSLPGCLPYIRRSLSDARINAYRQHPDEDDLDLLARYAWNMALGAALYAPLQCLEVALRNTLHDALTGYHGTERWYERRTAFRDDATYDKVQKAMAKVPDPSAPDAPGRVVAALDFGFWTTLLSRPYGSPSSRHTGWRRLWPELVTVAFPHFPHATGTAQDRATLAQRFDDIRRLRNRVSHHEPIWKGRIDQSTGRLVSLREQHEEIIEAIDWINPDLARAVRLLETRTEMFPQVFEQGPRPFRELLAGLP